MDKKQVEWRMEETDHKTIKYFCENFHYSKTAPASQFKFLFFENNEPVGVITFGKGANRNIAKPFGLEMENVLELTRCAFKKHHNYLSMYISKAIKQIKQDNKDIKLIVSYSDLRQQHEGALYKSANFEFDGERKMSGIEYFDEEKQRWSHQRNLWKDWCDIKENETRTFNQWANDKYKTRKQSPKYRWIKKVRKYD